MSEPSIIIDDVPIVEWGDVLTLNVAWLDIMPELQADGWQMTIVVPTKAE